jgi:hypothetical protein
MQEEIASYYYNSVKPLGVAATLVEQKNRNAELGIFQLNMEVLMLGVKLAGLVKDIILKG